MRITILTAAILSALSLLSTAAERGRGLAMETGFLFRFVSVAGEEFKYAVYVPRGYDASKAWPAIVFLHGAGECGRDGQKHLAVGLGPAVMLDAERWPFVVVFPQKPEVKKQWEEYDAPVMAMLEAAQKEWRVDTARVYLTGLSQGGHGTWAIAAAHPDRFAAIVPVCGYGDPSLVAAKVKGIPTWVFHGEADTSVKVDESRAMVAAITAAGGEPKLTTYPDVGHNSWDKAYREPELVPWLLSKTRPGK
jgi:predicted peptidase